MASEFSIVIPAFNRERFIAAAMESALGQTLPADAIIVVDDGSTDRTGEIVGRYGPPVRLIRIENNGAGPSRPRNVGIEAARSKYITLLDSDDRLEPTVLERHRAVFTKCPQAGLIGNQWKMAELIDGKLCNWREKFIFAVDPLSITEIFPATYLIPSAIAYEAYCGPNHLRPTGASLPRQVWAEIGGFDEGLRTSEDYDFFLRIIKRRDIVFIDIPLGLVVRHDRNLSAAHPGRVNDIRVLERELSCSSNPRITERLRHHLQDIYAGLGYQYRNARQYRLAISAYGKYRAYGGGFRFYWEAIAKLAVHRCLTGLRLRRQVAGGDHPGSE